MARERIDSRIVRYHLPSLVVNTPDWQIKAPQLASEVLRAYFEKKGMTPSRSRRGCRALRLPSRSYDSLTRAKPCAKRPGTIWPDMDVAKAIARER